jgi:regulatory protein
MVFVCNSLAAKAQSVAEIKTKLAKRGVTADEAAAVVVEATRLGYLDDAELAGQLARGHRTRGYGRRRALQALRRRGVPEPFAEEALEAVYGDADEDALARSALGSRRTDDDPSRRRAASFLVRRGFSPAAAWRAVRSARAP